MEVKRKDGQRCVKPSQAEINRMEAFKGFCDDVAHWQANGEKEARLAARAVEKLQDALRDKEARTPATGSQVDVTA